MGKALRADGALCFLGLFLESTRLRPPRKESRKNSFKKFCVLALINSTQHSSNRSVS